MTLIAEQQQMVHKFAPSKYQLDFFNVITTQQVNIVLSATAGSGKTKSIVEACKYIPYGKRALFCAFNKHSVTDLKTKLPATVDCSTLHSIGLKSLFNHYPPDSVKIKKEKQLDFIMPFFEQEKKVKEKWSKTFETDHLLSLIRATMTPLSEENVVLMAENYNLYPENQIIRAAITACVKLREYNNDGDRYSMVVDFQDMIELCVRNKEIKMPQYDFVFVDECQDCSALDQLFIERLIKRPRGRLIAVGDRRQAIYGFRGADVNSFDYFERRENTIKLPLSISYRCGKSIVSNAKKVYEEIEEWSENEEGIVRQGKLEEVQDGDMVLSRNLRPLVTAFFMLLEQGKKGTILGKELEKGLLKVLSGIDNENTINELQIYLDQLLKSKLEQLKNYTNPVKHPKYTVLEEKVRVVQIIAEKCENVGEVENMIERIFHDDSIAPIKLMTIHKSKGMESDTVFVIERFEGKNLIPNQHAVTKDQLVQEQNLKFVSYTRAKKQLVLVEL